MTEAEVATYLHVAVGTLRRWRAEGSGPPALRVGRTVRYRRRDVDGWLEQQAAEENGR
jgi:excisionase family DNA binding protein